MCGCRESHINKPELTVDTLLTDSRSLTYPQGTLFFAIETKSNDGHRFLAELFRRGVRNFVVSALERVPAQVLAEANVLVVDSALRALHSLAKAHRSRFHIPVIAVTGSRGKTVAKEWLYQLLRDDYRIVRSPRSYNSKIGVPLSLWEIDDNTTMAIIEAGISQEGEMQALSDMIAPTAGLLTSISHEHDEGFDTHEHKVREKLSLFAGCQSLVCSADNPVVHEALTETGLNATAFLWSRTDAKCPVFISDLVSNSDGTFITYTYNGKTSQCAVPFVQDEMAYNLLNCLSMLLLLGFSPEKIAERMATLTPVNMRIDLIEGINDCLITHDTYACDYKSLPLAIDFMVRRRTDDVSMKVILSDVLHETFSEDELYRHIAQLLEAKRVSHFVGIGPEMCAHSHLFPPQSQFFASTTEFLDSTTPSDFDHQMILVKGRPEFGFEAIVNMLEARQHESVLQVNLDALAKNYNFFRSRLKPTTKIACMLKASGYGAGSYELAKTLQDRGCAYIAVAAHDEGVDLRKAGITMPIMVLNPCVVNYRAMFAYHLEPEVFSIEVAQQIIREAQRWGISDYPVHIKVDSGMHRLGFTLEQLPELVALLQGQNAIRPASIFSHLAVADEPAKDDYTQSQFDYFDRCCDVLQQGFSFKIMRHILNTTGIVRFPEHQYDMVRLGIGLYGLKTLYDGSMEQLEPVSSLQSVVISIKQWPSGSTIGYGRRGVLSHDSRIATIPIGYADGIDRHYGNGAISVSINGHLCPTVGNICMDLCMVDVTDAPCKVGERVEIFGSQIPVERLAEARGTIHYEVLTSISQRIKRVYYRE